MRNRTSFLTVPLCAVVLSAAACVTTKTHEAALKDLENTKNELSGTRTQLAEMTVKTQNCDTSLATALDQNQQLVTKVNSMGQNVEQLLGEKGALSAERERLEGEQKTLAKEVEELRRIRAAADKRNAEYQTLLSKLRKMIDAGTLQVKMRNGRMLVQMSSDVVFPPGGTRIKSEASEALTELAHTLAQFTDRKFQVIGHSDSTPIRTARFPSNWELSTQRAIEVVRLLVEAGVPPEILSAAGSAEFDPVDSNDTPEGMSQNRRVEVVFMPKIDELPGFKDALPGTN